MCLKYHPDKCSDNGDQFIRIKTAYHTILNHKETNINFFLMFLFFVRNMNINAPDVQLKIDVPLEDVYNNRVKKIAYRRVNPSMKSEVAHVYLELFGLKPTYRLHGLGDYSMWTGQCSDLVISASIDYTGFEHIRCDQVLNEHDLHVAIKVNLYEFFFGIQRSIPFFNGEHLSIDHVPYKDGMNMVMENRGLCDEDERRGHLYVFFETDVTKCDEELVFKNNSLLKNMFDKK